MPRFKVRNLGYMLVATVCLLLYYNALVPSKNYNQDDTDELVDRWIEKKLDTVHERDTKIAETVMKNDSFGKGEPVVHKPPAKKAGQKINKAKKDPPKNSSAKEKKPPVKPIKEVKTQNKQSDWMGKMYEVQKQRKAHLRKICDTQMKRPLKSMDELGTNPKQLRPLIVNDKHKFIYSIVYKVGSTNWERVIVEDLEGYKNVPNQKLFSHKALRWMPGFTPEDAKERLKSYTKFMFVRNPLSRIVSAYKDKFVDHHNSVFTKMAKTIISMFRKVPYNESAIDPSFPEFIEYLVNNSNHRSNPHWKVIFNQNFPCELNYDIIGKLEDADDDIPFVLERIGIRNLTTFGSTVMKRKGSDEQLWARYFSQVPKSIMKKFYEVYRADFVLYGYEMPTSFQG